MKSRDFGLYQFDHVCVIEVDRDVYGNLIEYMPQNRYYSAATVPLNRYGKGPYVKFKIPRNLKHSGVYGLTVDDNLVYIGEAIDLSKRYNSGYGIISPRNCFKGGQETNCRINNLIHGMVSKELSVRLWFYPTTDYKAIEGELRRKLTPEWNRI